MWRYRLGDRLTGLGGAISNAGNVVEWTRRELEVDDPFGFAAADTPPAEDGLVVLPELAGERGPGYRPDARGAITGMTLRHTRHDLACELLLAVCGVYGDMADLFRAAQPDLVRFVATGGVVVGSPVFGQLLADATGAEVEISGVDESTLRGAALHVLREEGEPVPASPVAPRAFSPRPAWTAAIDARRARSAEQAHLLRSSAG